jgi:hypothetical protein
LQDVEKDVNTTINQIFTQFPSDGERSLKRENYGIRGTLVYSLSKQDEISAGAIWVSVVNIVRQIFFIKIPKPI